MTSSNKFERVTLRLATSHDSFGIQLLRKKNLEAQRAAQTHNPGNHRVVSSTGEQPGDQVLVAVRSSGEIVASIRLGIASTREELARHLGTELLSALHKHPVMTVRDNWASHARYYRALRYVSLMLAHPMDIADKPVLAQMGELLSVSSNAGFRVAVTMTAATVYEGTPVPGASHLQVVSKPSFMDAIVALETERSQTDNATWQWEGPIPFGHYLHADIEYLP